MREVAGFNQMKFLSDVMDIDGWEDALHKGSCTGLSAYFVKLALFGANVPRIGEEFERQKAAIAELQQQAVNLHKSGWDGYGYVLGQMGLAWSGGVYTDPNGKFTGGQCALCLIEFQNGDAHTIAILYDGNANLIYMFDPNRGVYEFEPAAWYDHEFHGFMNETYENIRRYQFNNVVSL